MMEPQDELVTRSEVQEMIDAAIRRHNRNASIISMCVGWVVLAAYEEGLVKTAAQRNEEALNNIPSL